MAKIGQEVPLPQCKKVDDEIRDKVFSQLRQSNGNNICLDCQKKNTKWASIHLGIHLCIDCAGKHRQYGVMYSFVKSTNLDGWNQKQILFMQKGGNNRALEYFRKRGISTEHNRHIDYKSTIVQQYKQMLTDEVQIQLYGGTKTKKVESSQAQEKDFFEVDNNNKKEEVVEIAVEVETVDPKAKKSKKTKKNIAAKQIKIDFEKLVETVDDGVPTQIKQKIVSDYEKNKDDNQLKTTQTSSEDISNPEPIKPKVEQPKQLSKQQKEKKIVQLKQQTNVKTISSDQFKDTSIDNNQLQQNLSRFSGSSSISSSAFHGEKQEKGNETLENLKDTITNVGGKLYDKFSSYWKK